MADEEVKSSSYLSFADRYQADLELIYQKYECFEDGTFESQEILLSTLGFEENDGAAWLEDFIDENVEERTAAADDDDSDGSSEDDGWESDSSGHTTTRELSSLDEAPRPNSANETLKELDEQNCEVSEKSKLKQFNHPLSSTLAIESSTTPEIEMDPKLSSGELQESDVFKDPKRLENKQRIHTLGQTSNSFMPGILDGSILTSTKLESSPDRSTPKQKLPPLPKDALWPQPITNKIDKRTLTDQIENNSSAQGISSFAQAVLNTRNRIANVLFKAVMDVQKGNLSKDSGYNSLSTDTSSSLTTVQSTSKGSLFLPDKLLKEFNNRLTAEIMGNGNNARRLAEPNHSFSDISLTPSLTAKESQSLKKKSRILIGPRVISNNKDKTVSLVTGKKTIKFNPSLPEFKKGIGSSSLLNDRKSVYIPLSVNTKTVDKQGHLSRAVSTKAVLKISPVQGSLPFPLVPKNVISMKTRPCERTSYGNSLPNLQEPVSLNLLREEKRRHLVEPPSRIRLIGKTSKPVVKLQSSSRPCISIPPRRSVPMTNCLPVTHSEILRHSTNLSDFQKLMQNHVKIPGRAREGFPGHFPGNPKDSLDDRLQISGLGHGRQAEGKNLPGRDGTEVHGHRLPGQNGNGHSGEISSAGSSRKRSFDSALFCSSEKTSPKRTCLRLNKNENKSSLKLGVGREKVVGANKNDKQQQILMNVKRNMLESLSNTDVPNDNGHGNSKKQESRTSSFEDEVVDCREGRRNQKLFMDGERCSYVLDDITPCDRVKILWKTSDNVNTRSGYENGYGNNAAEGRYQKFHGIMVQVGKERRIAVSPVQGNHLSKQLVEQKEQKQPEKKPVNGRNEDKCALVNTTLKCSCTITSQEESSGNKMISYNYETPLYKCAAEKRYSERLNKSSRKSFPGVQTSRRNSRPISELGDETSRNSTRTKYSSHREENNAMSLNSHEKLTSKKNLAPTTAEVPFSRRKRERESKDEDKAQERFNNGVCLNKTFKIDRKAVSDRSDSSACQSSTCRKLLCLNCGSFPSSIQDSCVSSDSSFDGE